MLENDDLGQSLLKLIADSEPSAEVPYAGTQRLTYDWLQAWLRRRMNNEFNFPPNFEGLVLGCIDADFIK